MRYLFWLAEEQCRLEERLDTAGDARAASIIAIAASVCKASYLDGFAPLEAERVSAETGLSVDSIERTIDELIVLGLMRERVTFSGERILEPATALRPKCRLLGWYDPAERRLWR